METEEKELTDEQFASYIKDAAKLGAVHGKNAAAWWEQDAIGGRNTRPDSELRTTARAVIQGIDDGDLAVLDGLPSVNLSGEWSGDMTPSRLAEELGLDPDSLTPEESDEICTAYENAAADAVSMEVYRLCQNFLRR